MLDHLPAGLGILQLDLRAGDVVDLRRRLACGNHLEPDERAPLAPNQLHHLVEVHVDDVGNLALRPLPHADDAILRLEPTVAVGGTAGGQLHDRRVAVLALELCADAVELQPHPDLKVLQRAGRHVAGVRIETARQRREVDLEQLVGRHLVPPLGKAAVPAEELFLGLLGGRLLHLLHEQVVLDPPPPEVFGLCLVPGPLRLVTIDDDRLGLREVVGLVDEPLDERLPRVHPLQEPAEHVVGKRDVTPLHEVVERLPLLQKPIDIALEEVDLHRVERLKERRKPPSRHFVVDRLSQKMLVLELAADGHGDVAIVRPGLHEGGRSVGLGRAGRRRHGNGRGVSRGGRGRRAVDWRRRDHRGGLLEYLSLSRRRKDRDEPRRHRGRSHHPCRAIHALHPPSCVPPGNRALPSPGHCAEPHHPWRDRLSAPIHSAANSATRRATARATRGSAPSRAD